MVRGTILETNKVFWLTYSVELSIRHSWLIHDNLQSLEQQFLSRRQKTLKRCVCYSVSLSKGGWEAERGLRMEKHSHVTGEVVRRQKRTEIVCVCVNQDTVSREA